MQGFLVVFANGHDFTDGAHLRPQLIFNAFKFFKGPAGKFDDDIIAIRHIAVESAVFTTRQVCQGQARCQFGRNESNREARCFRSQGRRTGRTRINFNDDNAACLGIAGKLDVRTANDADVFDNFVGLALQFLLHSFRNSQHRCRAERIARVDTDGVDVFDKADRDHVVVFITDDFQFQLFPAQD